MDKTCIHTNQFIIASLKKDAGKFSISERPTIHTSYSVALHEAQRLASMFKDKKFIVLGVAAVAEERPVEVPVITTYEI